MRIKNGQSADALPRAVSLAEIKSQKIFADSPLIRQGRLSVVPLDEKQMMYLASE